MADGDRGVRAGRGVFYGWWIVAAGFVIQILNGALLFHAYGAYVLPLKAEFGWNRTELSAAFALMRAETGLLGPLQGWLVDRYGPRRIMAAGIVVFGIGFIAFSRVQCLYGFYACFALIAVGSSLGGFLSIVTSVANWFSRRRSMAIGVVMAGMGTGGFMVPGVVWLIAVYGWRTAAVVSGGLILAIGLPATRLMRGRPEDFGQLPDGAEADSVNAGSATETGVPEKGDGAGPRLVGDSGDSGGREDPDLTASQAMRTSSFWLLCVVHGSALLTVGTVLMHQIPHMVEGVGLSPKQAAAAVALLMAFAITGQLAGGYLGDRINKRLVIFATMWMHAAAMLVFAYAESMVGAVVFTVLHGTAWGVRGTLLSTIRADYFGRRSFATISGYSSLVAMLGMTAGPLFSGAMFDLIGDYRSAFLILAGMAALGSVAALLAHKPSQVKGEARPI